MQGITRREWLSGAAALAMIMGVGGVRSVAAKTGESGVAPLVSREWLKARLDKPGIVILDVTSPRFYARGHIPGAVFTAYDDWRAEINGVPGVMLPPEKLAAMIGALGIGNEDHVIVVPAGFSSGDVGMATRVYWSLKTMGHGAVSMLAGGMRGWMAAKGFPLEKGSRKPQAKRFEPHYTEAWLARAADVEEALKTKAVQLIDNRPVGQHKGVFKSGSVKRYGTIPGAINVPEDWLAHKGKLLTRAQAARLHELLGVKPGAAIHFCNTGHRASLGWFVRSEMLGEPSKLYDGSLAEWTRLDPATHPVVAALDIHAIKG